MRKIILSILIIGLVVSFLVGIRTLAASFLNQTRTIENKVIGNIIALDPARDLAIVQGASDQALTVSNRTNVSVTFNLGHAHGHLTLEPENDTLAPGATSEITMIVDDFCPSGKVDLLVFLLAETENESFAMETIDLTFDVLPGELILAKVDDQILISWNGDPAPPGVALHYRDPFTEEKSWKYWGETPNLYPPANLRKGIYSFEFKAIISNVESNIELIEIFVEGEEAPAAASAAGAAGQSAAAAATEEAPPATDTGNIVHTVKMEVPEGTQQPAKVVKPPTPKNANPLDLF